MSHTISGHTSRRLRQILRKICSKILAIIRCAQARSAITSSQALLHEQNGIASIYTPVRGRGIDGDLLHEDKKQN
jgi:hypothetical protein